MALSNQTSMDSVPSLDYSSQEKPNLKPDLLHPLLLKYIPYYKAIDAKFIRNFR
jgi:hypothetical protein